MLTKKKFRKTGHYRLLQVLFWGTLIPACIALILLGIFESDVELSGFVWAGVLILVYWLAKRILYYVLFGESIIPRRKR